MAVGKIFKALSKISKIKGKISEDHGENICGLFHVFTQFLFTTSKTEFIITTRKWMHKLSQKLLNDLKHRILGN